jgi:hypothetical protein
MRFAFLVSGAFGFLLVGAVGLASGRDFEPVLRDAALACLAFAFVGRWFWGALEKAFAQSLAAHHAAARVESGAPAASAAAVAAPAHAASSAAPSRPPHR